MTEDQKKMTWLEIFYVMVLRKKGEQFVNP